MRITSNLLLLLGVEAHIGRTLLPEDQPEDDQVVLLSHAFWQQRFGSDQTIIGKRLTLDNRNFIVLGVLPPSFWLHTRDIKVWVPFPPLPRDKGRGSHNLNVIARLRSNVELKQAQAEMSTIAQRLEQQYPTTNTGFGVRLIPLNEHVVRNAKPALLLLQGAVVVVLLVACANVASLLLTRTIRRRREIAIRMSVGAGRLRIIQQLLTESVLLAALGGGVGLLMAFWGIDLLVSAIPDYIISRLPSLSEVRIDIQVLSFTFVLSVLTGIVFGIAPALQASNLNVNEFLKEDSLTLTTGVSRRFAHRLLVICQIGCAVMLLSAAGLMIRSFLYLQRVEPGFNPKNVLTMMISLPQSKYSEANQRSTFYRQILDQVEALGNNQRVALVNHVPLSNTNSGSWVTVEGHELPRTEQPLADYRVITPNYFRTLGISIVIGRSFDEIDTPNSPSVVIINETMARRFWRGDPIGKRLKLGSPESGGPWHTVVGVVRDVRHWLEEDPRPEMYAPLAQDPWRRMFLIVRADSDPLNQVGAIREKISNVDKDQPISNIRTMEQMLSDSIAPWRLYVLLLTTFAVGALLLAILGIYSVVSYSVSQRTQEIGIRVAMGANATDILKLIMREGIVMSLIGVTMGLAGALILIRMVSSALFLHGTSSTDPITFVGLALISVGTTLAACYLPARRAVRLEPAIALRYE